jgi:hypothetical protein
LVCRASIAWRAPSLHQLPEAAVELEAQASRGLQTHLLVARPAHPAAPARLLADHHHPIARAHGGDLAADLDDDAGALVAEPARRLHRSHQPVHDLEIGGAQAVGPGLDEGRTP